MTGKAIQVVEGWTGPGRRDAHIERLKPVDDGLHIGPRQKGRYEWWYFDTHLETGHTIPFFYAEPVAPANHLDV